MLDLEHVQLGFGLSALELVLSLQSGKVGMSSSLSGSSLLCLLDSLGSKELLLLLLGLELLGSFLSLEFLKLLSSLLGEGLLLLSFLLRLLNFLLEIEVLLELFLSDLLFLLKSLEELLLLSLLLLLQSGHCLALGKVAAKSDSLLVSLFSGELESVLHVGKLGSLVSSFLWLFASVWRDSNNHLAFVDLKLRSLLHFLGESRLCWLAILSWSSRFSLVRELDVLLVSCFINTDRF